MNKTIVAESLQAIYDSRGRLTPADVVEEAAAEFHPLHVAFEWDDTEAARRFRLTQAGGLIRSVKVRLTTEHAGDIRDLQVRGWVSSKRAEVTDRDGYLPNAEVEQSPQMQEALLRQMRRDIQALTRRYSDAKVFWEMLVETVQQKPEAASG